MRGSEGQAARAVELLPLPGGDRALFGAGQRRGVNLECAAGTLGGLNVQSVHHRPAPLKITISSRPMQAPITVQYARSTSKSSIAALHSAAGSFDFGCIIVAHRCANTVCTPLCRNVNCYFHSAVQY